MRQSGTGAGKQDVSKCHIVLMKLDFLRDVLKQVEFCYDAIHYTSTKQHRACKWKIGLF